MADFVQYWTPATADDEAGKPNTDTWWDYRHEINSGDHVWVVTAEEEQLFLLSRAIVLHKTNRDGYIDYFGKAPNSDKDTWLIFQQPYDLIKWRNITDIANDIRFENTDRDRLPENPKIWGNALQSTRTLTSESVGLLSKALDSFSSDPPELDKDFWNNLFDNDFYLEGDDAELIGAIFGEVSNHEETSVSDLANTLGAKRGDIIRLIDYVGRVIATEQGVVRRVLPGHRYFANWEIFFDGRAEGKELFWKLKPALLEVLNDISDDDDREAIDDDSNVANLSESEIDKEKIVGAGFGDAISNREVEKAAIDFVTLHYTSLGWTVTSKEQLKCGYDLLCEHGDQTHHVEVKGIKGAEESVIITKNEVAYLEQPFSFMCIVSTALSSPKLTSYSGEEFKRRFKLQPYSFIATKVEEAS